MDAVPFKLFKLVGGDGWGFNSWQKMIKEYIKVQLNELIPHARNPRKNDSAVEAVSKSIKETGYITPIIVDEKNEILCGHTRAKSLKKLGHSEVEVLKVTGLTDEQKKRYRILDNKTGEVAEWDFEILQEDFKLDELVDLGFDIKDLDQGEVVEDEAPPIPETPKTVKGDVYELGTHRVMCGDSTFLDSIEKLLNGDKPSLLFTDPPYGINYSSKNMNIKTTQQFDVIKNDDIELDFNILFSFECDQIFWGANNYMKQLPHKGIWFCWDKRSDGLFDQNLADGVIGSNFELAWVNRVTGYYPIFRVKHGGVVNKDGHNQKRLHPTQKPIDLIKKCFDWLKAKESIFDPFLGSGSTLIACEQTGRTCYGMELDEKYCDVIVQRWVNFTKQTKIKRNGIDMEWPVSEKNQ